MDTAHQTNITIKIIIIKIINNIFFYTGHNNDLLTTANVVPLATL